MEIPKELLPPSKEKETPASLTDPIIRNSNQPNPQAIMAMSKISSQVNYQSKIGNPLAVSGPYGLGAINPMMSPNAGREVLNTHSPIPDKSLGIVAKTVAKRGAVNLLVRAGLLAKGMTNLTPLGVASNLLAGTSELNAGEEDWLRSREKGVLFSVSPAEQAKIEEQWKQQALYEEAQRRKEDEIFQKQQREREERWSNMKTEELNTKLQSSDDHIGRYFSRRAIK